MNNLDERKCEHDIIGFYVTLWIFINSCWSFTRRIGGTEFPLHFLSMHYRVTGWINRIRIEIGYARTTEKAVECCWKGFNHEETEGPRDGDAESGYHLKMEPHETAQYAVTVENEKGEYVCYADMW